LQSVENMDVVYIFLFKSRLALSCFLMFLDSFLMIFQIKKLNVAFTMIFTIKSTNFLRFLITGFPHELTCRFREGFINLRFVNAVYLLATTTA